MKKYIIGFILGALIFGGIVGVSAYTILANDIGYTPKDSTWKKSNGEDITNVSDAIDDLYIKANKELEFGTTLYNQNLGDFSSTRSTSLKLTKGKYIVSIYLGLGSGNNSSANSVLEATNNLDCASCLKTKISGKYYDITPTNQVANNLYSYGVLRTTTYYVEITADEDIVKTNWSEANDNTYIGEIVALQAIPIN